MLKDDKKAFEKYRKGARDIAERFDSKSGADQAVKIYKELLAWELVCLQIPTPPQ